MVLCDVCSKEIEKGHEDYTIKVGRRIYHYCSHEHLSTSDTVKNIA